MITMSEPIAGIYPLNLEDIVSIDTFNLPLSDLASDGFKERLDELETIIATGIKQLYAYIGVKPGKARDAVLKHNQSMMSIKAEIQKNRMLILTSTCPGCGKIFSARYSAQQFCDFCWDGE